MTNALALFLSSFDTSTIHSFCSKSENCNTISEVIALARSEHMNMSIALAAEMLEINRRYKMLKNC